MKTNTNTPQKKPIAEVIESALAQVTELPWFEGFHAGKHIDRHGKEFEFTRDELQQMVDNFEPNTVPFVISHPEADTPSYGFAKEIKLADDDKLYINGNNVDIEFATSVIKGHFGRRSLGLQYSKEKGWHIDHVAFLGAQAPALNLQPVGEYKFSAEETTDANQFEFSVETQTANLLVKFLRGFKTYVRTSGMNEEDAERMINEWEIDWLQRASIRQEIKDESNDDLSYAYSTPTDTTKPQEDDVSKFTQAELDDAIAKAKKDARANASAEFSQQSQDDKNRIAQLEKDKAEMQFNQRVKDNQIWINSQISAGTLRPAQAEGLAEFMAYIEPSTPTEGEGKFEFSRGEGDKAEKVKKAPVEFMKALIENGSKHGLTDDIALYDVPAGNDADALLVKARQYQKGQSDKGIEISIEEAISHVDGGDA